MSTRNRREINRAERGRNSAMYGRPVDLEVSG